MVYYPIPLNQQPAVADKAVILHVGDEMANKVISLPMSPYLDHDSQNQIVEKITKYFKK